MPRNKNIPDVKYVTLPDDGTIEDVFDYIFSLILEDDSV